ncbi:MAG: restriction endonuclease subunit S [Clostridia bacterium]|nr:restriction endonuclease subunit S [Clostridia bacterium]
MKQKIKERVEQINNGIVPKGYKKTPVGICPVGWELIKLSDVFDFKNGLNKEKKAFGFGTPIVNYVDVYKKAGLKYKDLKGKVNLNQNEIDNYNVKKGDMFFTRTSETLSEIGFSSVMLDDCTDTVFSGFILRARPRNDFLVNEFNQYCFSSKIMRNEIIKKSSYTTRALTNGNLLGQVFLNKPYKYEQQKIAEILTVWDETIELQEKLINKLEEKKKALMQKLLTPQDDWQEVKLSDVINFYNGYAFKSKLYCKNGIFKIITIGNVKSNEMDVNDKISTINEVPLDLQKHQLLKIDDILISMTGNVGRVCMVNQKNCLLNQRVGKIEVKEDFDKSYFYQILQSYNFAQKMKSIAQGAAQDNISVKDIKKYKCFLPNINKQNKIAEILTTFDKKIELQKQLLNKYKEQRKAMMQMLLTGIVRVV